MLDAETIMEANRDQLEIEQIRATLFKTLAETQKLQLESGKINRETVWYPLMVSAAIIGAVATAVLGLVKFFYG